MYQLHTKKQLKYFDEVIRLHYEEGYGGRRIERLLPVAHHTISDWIAIFEKEKGNITRISDMLKPQENTNTEGQNTEVEELRKRVKELEAQLKKAEIKAEFYDEMINVAEAKFRIPIRKKAGAKQ